MKRALILLTALAALAASASSPASAPRSAGAGAGTHVGLRHTARGTILVNRRGFTLYAFKRDARNRDRCISIPGCTSVWPVLATSGRPVPGRGVRRGLLGSIRLAGGRRQVTYAGHPLYTYVGDAGPGDTSYVGVSQFGGAWKAVNAAGRLIG